MRRDSERKGDAMGVLVEDDEIWCCVYIWREGRGTKEGFGNGKLYTRRG